MTLVPTPRAAVDPLALPTSADFDRFFPELTVDADESTPLIARAALWVDPNLFAPQDYQPAILNLAAHYLVLIRAAEAAAGPGGDASGGSSGQGGSSSSTQGGTQTYISEVRIDGRLVKYALAGGKSSSSTSRSALSASQVKAGLTPTEAGLGGTMYGLEYIRLRSRNIIPIAVV